ncbi:CD226 antigen-like [Pyxicephalus adspersus]|uniref:CD226 antigen-like n=1 Tax=Pyxicephalus adspersus TaxID=30357 RepID=UPI003B5CCD2E
MYTIKNPNGTETTISNFTHKVTENRDEKVICVVSHPTLHSDIYLSTFLDDTRLEEYSVHLILQLLCAIIIIIIIIVTFFTLRWKLQVSKKASEGRFIFACVLSSLCMTASVNVGIQTKNVEVEFGESATLKCLLTKSDNLNQVTWKKIGKGIETKLATYIKGKGFKVDKPYENLMNFSISYLNESTITIYKARLEDEGCYACIFNVFPEGAKEGRVCLSIPGEVLIEKNHKVKVGDRATLKCHQRNPENITQISWLKNEALIAIYKNGDVSIKSPFEKLVDLRMELTHVSALTILNAAIGDEGEYKCVFNNFPKGSAVGKTKLQVYSFANRVKPEMIALTFTFLSILLWL